MKDKNDLTNRQLVVHFLCVGTTYIVLSTVGLNLGDWQLWAIYILYIIALLNWSNP